MPKLNVSVYSTILDTKMLTIQPTGKCCEVLNADHFLIIMIILFTK